MSIAAKKLGAYKKQNVFSGWTRIDLLLQLYDRAVEKVTDTKSAMESGDNDGYVQSFVDSQKTILAIHSGLKADEHDVAFNVARLLHFVLQSLAEKKFDDAIKVLSELRDGFNAIHIEANELEASGQIPPMDPVDMFRTRV
jgi:flagellin-specific chaperone FliS